MLGDADVTQIFRAGSLTLNSNTDHVTAQVVNAITGTSGPIDLTRIANGLLVVNVTGVTGTSPSLGVFFDTADGFGNWCQISSANGISGAALTSTGTVYGNISQGYQLTAAGRIRWTVSSGASFTGVSLSLYGRV